MYILCAKLLTLKILFAKDDTKRAHTQQQQQQQKQIQLFSKAFVFVLYNHGRIAKSHFRGN